MKLNMRTALTGVMALGLVMGMTYFQNWKTVYNNNLNYIVECVDGTHIHYDPNNKPSDATIDKDCKHHGGYVKPPQDDLRETMEEASRESPFSSRIYPQYDDCSGIHQCVGYSECMHYQACADEMVGAASLAR